MSSGEGGPSSSTFLNRYFKESKLNLQQDYDLHEQLGDGAFSVVYRALKKDTGQNVAVKVIKKEKVSLDDLKKEVEIWKKASHSSSRVVSLYDIYENEKVVYLVMEYCTGGELFEKIVNMTDYNEIYAAKIMKQIFYIIRDLHKVDIIHQDLKPENLLLFSPDSMIIKLCDFGLAEIADDTVELFGKVGSTTYMAPEVVEETGHHKPVDLYAAGVIMYILLCGYPPFEPQNGIIELEFPPAEWSEISYAAKELITHLLHKDPNIRGSPDDVLKDKWFIDVETVRNPKALTTTIDTLKKYQQIGPNGTMRDYRGGDKSNQPKRSSIIGLFDNDKIIKEEKESKPRKKSKKSTDNSSHQAPLTSPKKKTTKKHSVSSAPKKKKIRGHRASTSIVELLKLTGEFDRDFDPKGLFDENNLNKKWNEKTDINPEIIDKARLQLEQYDISARKKKEERKSQKKRGLPAKLPKRTPNIIDKEDSPRLGSNNISLDHVLDSLHREIRTQRYTVEHLWDEFLDIRNKLNTEIDNSKTLSEKLIGDVAQIKSEVKDDRNEIKILKTNLETIRLKTAEKAALLATSSPPDLKKKKTSKNYYKRK